MHKIVGAVLLGLALSASAAFAAEDEGEPPVCKRAMVNPVSGTVFCIEPRGAPVEPPPPQDAEPCKQGNQAGGIWTPGSGCKEE